MNFKSRFQQVLKKNRNLSMIMFIIISLFIFCFFFMSKTLFMKGKQLKHSDIDSVITIDQRDITLAKWVYCKDSKKMEIEFDIVNTTYDGNDVYKFDVVDRKGNKYNSKVVVTAPTMSVVQIEDVPDDFSEIRIAMNVDYTDRKADEIAKFYTNHDQVEMVDQIITYNNLEEYYVAKLNRYIDNYNEEIANTEKCIDTEKTSVENYNDLISNLNMQKNYAAGDELNNINKQIAETNKLLIAANKKIAGYRDDIINIKRKIDDYEAIKKAYESGVTND